MKDIAFRVIQNGFLVEEEGYFVVSFFEFR